MSIHKNCFLPVAITSSHRNFLPSDRVATAHQLDISEIAGGKLCGDSKLLKTEGARHKERPKVKNTARTQINTSTLICQQMERK